MVSGEIWWIYLVTSSLIRASVLFSGRFGLGGGVWLPCFRFRWCWGSWGLAGSFPLSGKGKG